MALIAAFLSVLISLSVGFEMIGHRTRLVEVLTLFAGGVSCGVSLVRARDALKASHLPSESEPAK